MIIDVKDHKIELKDYITGGQSMELKKMQLQSAKMTNFDSQTQSGDIEMDLSITIDIQKKALEFLAISIDDIREDVVAKILDLPSQDFEKVLSIVDEIRGEKKSLK